MSEAVSIRRDRNGVRQVRAGDVEGAYWGMGWCHARDRGMQMLLTRILGRGRACELLDGGEAMLEVDRFFRQMNWGRGAEATAAAVPEPARGLCAAYCRGVNAAFAKRTPWELRLMGYRPEPWTLADSILLSRMTGYMSLAQSQADIERLVLEMVQAGVGRGMIEDLFPGGVLDGLDEELVRKVKLVRRVVPDEVRWNVAVPRMMASNNWVVGGWMTASGKPMLANDPHLETNRLPAIWYEIAMSWGEDYGVGATMPGLPALIIGRTRRLAWGVTYAFMDAVDSWVERCRDGACYREPDRWEPLRKRTELIRRKGREPVEATFYENEHGVLEGDPFVEGYYLATRWSGSESGAESVAAFAELLHARDVESGMKQLGRVESAWNWVLADDGGNIGYQMSGLLPRRRPGVSGFVPAAGWKKENDWGGYVAAEQLPRRLNPKEGFFITANNDLNGHGQARAIAVAMSDDRAERIRRMLEGRRGLDAADMQRMQYDTYSVQAERFMGVIRPLLPDTAAGRALGQWDCRYEVDSRGAVLFERVYGGLLEEVFGRRGVGVEVCGFLRERSSIVAAYFGCFDRVLLAERSAWFGTEAREAIYRRVIGDVLDGPEVRWGRGQRMTMRHLLLGGKLAGFVGFDRGPYEVRGGRASVHQAQLFHSRGRFVAVTPTYHMVADLGQEGIETNLCGGVSDRRFSWWYASDVKRWLRGRYKRVGPGGPA